MVLSLDRSPPRWLESLKLSSARCCLWSAWPSVFSLLLLLHCLSSFSLSSVFFLRCSVSSACLFVALKPFYPMVVRFPFHFCRITCCSFAWISLLRRHHQGYREWPTVLLHCASLLHQFGFSITSWNESFATLVVKLDVKFLYIMV